VVSRFFDVLLGKFFSTSVKKEISFNFFCSSSGSTSRKGVIEKSFSGE